MAIITNRMADPGPLIQCLETQILQHKEIEAQAKRDVRCKMIQAVALVALFIIAVVAAFVLTSLYAPNYAPIVLFAGTYFLIGHMGQFLKTNFKDVWKDIEKTAEKVQSIAKKHFEIMQNDTYKQSLLTEHASNDETHLQKYTYLAAHRDYWLEQSEKAFAAHNQKFEEADALLHSPQSSDQDKKRGIKYAICAQQLHEIALQSRVEAAFMEAFMQRPDYLGTQKLLYDTHYAPISLNESDDDLTLNISFFDSPWAQNLIDRDLPPYKNRFVDIKNLKNETVGSLLRSEVRRTPEKISKAFVQAMDEQMVSMREALNQGGSGNSA
jgi:hypothetical protein